MSKYNSLWKYLKQNQKENYQLSFKEIEKILNFQIDHSFLTYKKEVVSYGYLVEKISMKDQYILFRKLK